MQIIRAYPPNFLEIVSVFPRARGPGVMFTYDDRLYSPSGVNIVTPALMAHEEAHSRRQVVMHPDVWWQLYLCDRIFRMEEELIGHRAEYEHIIKQFTGKMRDHQVRSICERLSGPLYGHVMSYSEAEYAVTCAA